MSEMIKEFMVFAGDLVKAFCKKISVFKITKQWKVKNDAHGKEEFPDGFRITLTDQFPPSEVAAYCKDQQQQEYAACFEIKKQTHQ